MALGTRLQKKENAMSSTMSKSELDRWYNSMRSLRELLSRPQEEDEEIRGARRDLRQAENAFAAETPIAWVAIVCEDYTCPNTGAPYQQLLPVSRYRGIETTTDSYGFGKMRFEVEKRGGRVQGIRFRSKYDLDTLGSEQEPVDELLDPTFPNPVHGYNVYFCVFKTEDEASAWLGEQEGILFEDSVQITIDRLRSKI